MVKLIVKNTLEAAMKNDNVVNINRENDLIIKELEQLIAHVRSGSLNCFVGLKYVDGVPDFIIVNPDFDCLQLVGALEVLKAELLAPEEYEDD